MRRFSDIVIFIVVISGVFLMVGLMLDDFGSQFPEVNINDSVLDGFDKTDGVRDTTEQIQSQLEGLQNPETGFFAKIGLGIGAIANVVLVFPVKIIGLTITAGTSLITDFGDTVGLDPTIIAIGILILSVIIIFKLVEWYHRSPT